MTTIDILVGAIKWTYWIAAVIASCHVLIRMAWESFEREEQIREQHTTGR